MTADLDDRSLVRSLALALSGRKTPDCIPYAISQRRRYYAEELTEKTNPCGVRMYLREEEEERLSITYGTQS